MAAVLIDFLPYQLIYNIVYFWTFNLKQNVLIQKRKKIQLSHPVTFRTEWNVQVIVKLFIRHI